MQTLWCRLYIDERKWLSGKQQAEHESAVPLENVVFIAIYYSLTLVVFVFLIDWILKLCNRGFSILNSKTIIFMKHIYLGLNKAEFYLLTFDPLFIGEVWV
jgi:hypothetical protein